MKRFLYTMINIALSVVLVALPLCTLLSSCNMQNDKVDDDCVQFADALGRHVSVARGVKRVAALIGSFADVWVLSGGELCAAAEDAWDDFGLERGDAVSIGGAHSPSLELLIASEPELVLASASTASNVELKDALESRGITVAYFDVDCFDDYLAMLDICTDITGRKDLYVKNGTEIKVKIDGIKAAYAKEPLSDADRTVLLLRVSASSVKAKSSKGTVLGEMLCDMGCINIADSDATLLENLSVESVLLAEPRHIFAVTMGNDREAAIASLENMINGNPAWSSLEAIKSGRLHLMEKTLFNLKPNARWAEAYGELYEKLTDK